MVHHWPTHSPPILESSSQLLHAKATTQLQHQHPGGPWLDRGGVLRVVHALCARAQSLYRTIAKRHSSA